MMVLVTYDVDITIENGAKRLRRVAKECKNYGQRVQNSVFECVVTDVQLIQLKSRLAEIIDRQMDSVRIYLLGNNWPNKVLSIGKETSYDVTSTLIL